MEKSSKPWYKKWWGIILTIAFFPFVVPYLVWTKTTWNKWGKIAITAVCIIFLVSKANNSSQQKEEVLNLINQNEITQTETQESPALVGCTISNPTINYSLLAESTRQSDVKNISIKECYILLEKKAPTVAELTQLATVLGKNNENIEFEIFDDAKAYTLYEKYVATHTENNASDEDWKFLYDHFLAFYLKANTHLSNNYLQPVGNNYYGAGQGSISKVLIVN